MQIQATAREAGEDEGCTVGGTATPWPCSAMAESSFPQPEPGRGARSRSSMPRVARAAQGKDGGRGVGGQCQPGGSSGKGRGKARQRGALWAVGRQVEPLSVHHTLPTPGAAQMLQMSMQSLSSSSSSSSSESLSREDSWLEVSTTSKAGWQRLSFFTLAADWAERIADCSGRRNGGGQLLVQAPPPSETGPLTRRGQAQPSWWDEPQHRAGMVTLL